MNLSAEQRAIRARVFHQAGNFEPFPKQELERSISERFEKIARRFPQRLAVKTRTAAITYHELNKRANLLAHELLARRGATPEPVGLYFDEWSPLVIASLAVLKAGKFSVALDASGEAGRLAHIVDDSGLKILIVDDDTAAAGEALAANDCSILNLSRLGSEVGATDPGIKTPPEAICYLRYTSGSTGSAKGAIKTQRHVLRDTMGFINEFHICPEDRVTHLRLGAIGKHMLEALLSGACFCPLDARKEGLVRVGQWLQQECVTLFHSFPTALRYLLNSLPESVVFDDLRLVELEGEAVYKSDVALLQRHASADCVLVNNLSAAETGTVSWYFVDNKISVVGDRVPVGYPVEGVEVQILDDSGNALGVDQVGEVAVRSNNLSGGYWRKPDVTREKFVRQSDDDATRSYRTGDLGRLAADGCLHLLGRKDFQVKIRGYRVDVTEVETALMEQGKVRSVAVVGQNDSSGNTALVAYIVPREKVAIEGATFKDFLKGKLPDFMIPSKFIFLDELPMMSTGKINRRALPALPIQQSERTRPMVPPRTPVEVALAQIWSDVLSLGQVGVDDNFFDLGGHSLAASQIVSRAIQSFRLELPITALFDAPTVAEMAVVVERSRMKRAGDSELEQMLREVEAISDAEAARQADSPSGTVSRR